MPEKKETYQVQMTTSDEHPLHPGLYWFLMASVSYPMLVKV